MSSVIILNETPAEIDQIFDGRKRYIYRKTRVSDKSTSIYLNCLEAGNLIVGEIQIKGILILSPEALWAKTKAHSGLSKEEFFRFFKRHQKAYAYRLGGIVMMNQKWSPTNHGPFPHDLWDNRVYFRHPLTPGKKSTDH